MHKTTFIVNQMDCPAEEQMIRLRLEKVANISSLKFDIPARRLEVFHEGDHLPILAALDSLDLDTRFLESSQADPLLNEVGDRSDRRILTAVLLINLFFFVFEMVFGFFAHSMGLVADSLDMLADSLVYGMAIFAIGSTLQRKRNIARISGYLQMLLAVSGFVEVLRRFLGYEQSPAFLTMIIVSFLALIGNSASLVLLQKSKNKEAHVQASLIFTSNDVIINAGVILAGVLVFFTHSRIPDLVVGGIVFVIVARGALRILKLSSN